MSDRPYLYLRMSAVMIAVAVPSCGLVRAPFKVAGAVVEGTARVGKKAYDKSAGAFKDSDEEKAAKAKEKEEKEAKEKAGEKGKDGAEPKPEDVPPGAPQEPAPPGDYLPPLPGTDQPLPDDSAVPYQGQ